MVTLRETTYLYVSLNPAHIPTLIVHHLLKTAKQSINMTPDVKYFFKIEFSKYTLKTDLKLTNHTLSATY